MSGNACIGRLSPLPDLMVGLHIACMPQSFTAKTNVALADSEVKRRKVLVTGTAGNIGSYFAEHCARSLRLRLMTRKADEAKDAVER